MVGDALARLIDPPPPNFVVSVKHPATMLARLLFGLHKGLRVYLSYNIANARTDETYRNVTDSFRRSMHAQETLAVFDPLTIDELPAVAGFPESSAGNAVFSYDGRNPVHRWPILDADRSLSPEDDLTGLYPLSVPMQELGAARRAIWSQVRIRDFRLIDQSHYVLVYRPTLTGGTKISSGVQAEIDYAAHSGRPTILYVKKGEDQLPISSPFLSQPGDDPFYVYEDSEERLWEVLRSLEKPVGCDKSFLS